MPARPGGRMKTWKTASSCAVFATWLRQMPLPVRGALAVLCTVQMFSFLAQSTAAQETYPARTIRMVVPYVAGGGTDASARIYTQFMSARLGQQIVVENVGGAGGVVGTNNVARAQPDGYTLLYAPQGP